MAEMVRVYKMTVPDVSNNWLAVRDIRDLVQDFDYMEVGDKVVITRVEMDKDEYDNLGEFGGF